MDAAGGLPIRGRGHDFQEAPLLYPIPFFPPLDPNGIARNRVGDLDFLSPKEGDAVAFFRKFLNGDL
jgi:hypothetical protein